MPDQTGPVDPSPNTVTFGSNEGSSGSIIGSYHLLEVIGHGGMGEVWLAEQRQPVRRRVALKLIKAGMDTREVVARFESERQALALMDHPNIAKVFDAGSTPQGRPYFVMEYVLGVSITDFCERHKLTVPERLLLFVSVCEGVQHAHQKAIIHRDLKPSNILISEIDGKPVPKIIDFGVAKATAAHLGAGTVYTQVGAIIGTPGYMSPEQADSAGLDVDTRTDVYSLGVVLYELLAGAPPIDFSTTPFDQFPRRLRDEDAPRPSTRLAKAGGPDVVALASQLRGDLDAIVLKALEKDRARRYATPAEFAADIKRYLSHEAILARPATAGYRARKYVRRHRLGVSVALIATVLLIAVGVAQTFELRRTMIERDRANRERDRANRLVDFMTGMFKVSNPSEARGNDIKAREILDKASHDIGTGLARDPELQAQMLRVMGEVYRRLGLYSKAESLLSHAVALGRSSLGPRNPETLQAMESLANTLTVESRFPEAEKLERETIDGRRAALGSSNRDTLESMSHLGSILNDEGHYPEAEKQHEAVVSAATKALGPEDDITVAALDGLGVDLEYQDRSVEAEKLFRRVLEMDRRKYGPDHPDVLSAMNDVATTLQREHHNAEAEKLYRELLQAQRHVLGPDHPDTLMVMGNLGGLLAEEKQYAEAEKLLRETLGIESQKLGPENDFTLVTTSDLAHVLSLQGRYLEAERLARQALAVEQRVLGPDHNDLLETMRTLGDILKGEKRYEDAEATYRLALDGQRRVLGENHPLTAETAYHLACALALNGKREEAFQKLQDAFSHHLSKEDREDAEKNPDLKPLRNDPRFASLTSAPGR